VRGQRGLAVPAGDKCHQWLSFHPWRRDWSVESGVGRGGEAACPFLGGGAAQRANGWVSWWCQADRWWRWRLHDCWHKEEERGVGSEWAERPLGRTEVAGSKGHFDWLAAMNKIWTSHWAGKGQWAEIGRGRENQFWNWFSKYNDFRNSNQGDFEVKKNLEKFQKSSRFLLVF
jgi:hypothetical protein